MYGYCNCQKFNFRIVQSVSTRFYRHLCNWLIYGELFDLYDEFFIYDAKCPDENFLYPENVRLLFHFVLCAMKVVLFHNFVE